MAAELGCHGPAEVRRDAGHWADEVFDHPIGIGMVDIESVKFAIGWEIDPGLAL